MVTIEREHPLLRRIAEAKQTARQKDKILDIAIKLGQHWSYQTQELPKAPDPNALKKREALNQAAIAEHIAKRETETQPLDPQSIIDTQPIPEKTRPSFRTTQSTRLQKISDTKKMAALEQNHGRKPFDPNLEQTLSFREAETQESVVIYESLEETQPSERTQWIETGIKDTSVMQPVNAGGD